MKAWPWHVCSQDNHKIFKISAFMMSNEESTNISLFDSSTCTMDTKWESLPLAAHLFLSLEWTSIFNALNTSLFKSEKFQPTNFLLRWGYIPLWSWAAYSDSGNCTEHLSPIFTNLSIKSTIKSSTCWCKFIRLTQP